MLALAGKLSQDMSIIFSTENGCLSHAGLKMNGLKMAVLHMLACSCRSYLLSRQGLPRSCKACPSSLQLRT